MAQLTFGDVTVDLGDDFVATVEIHRPPDNYFDFALIQSLGSAYEELDAGGDCRAIVLCSDGKNFCAGADFSGRDPLPDQGGESGTLLLYRQAARLFRSKTPVVAAVQGAAVGGGLGLACSADFRIGCAESRFTANFARLGIHPGFAVSITLPRIVGQQRALDLVYTGRRVAGDEAAAIGLIDRLVDLAEVRDAAHELAAQIAASAPLAVRSIRETARAGLLDQLEATLERESAEQDRLRTTADWTEGVRAMAERRTPGFLAR
jgi:2-(1,2-epoxy-1,2-dihydrophenyl)acetyl-CoA isomerase